ncbi:MAG: DMP19 family protein [Clostridia bacterium]|nr:DMP19 family protein [Clostridia bacterium]
MFGLFRKKKVKLTEKELKWNKMWELWTEERTDSPYSELMTYQSEVNNGGHAQYFDNVSGIKDLQSEMLTLKTILPPKLASALEQAYAAYLTLEEHDDAQAEEILSKCDSVFYEQEEEINRILAEYAFQIEL